jgi:hypothetical protein
LAAEAHQSEVLQGHYQRGFHAEVYKSSENYMRRANNKTLGPFG